VPLRHVVLFSEIMHTLRVSLFSTVVISLTVYYTIYNVHNVVGASAFLRTGITSQVGISPLNALTSTGFVGAQTDLVIIVG